MNGRRGQDGMTLIETLVTVLVITAGLLVTLSVFSQMGRATYVAQRKAVLISIAQREMERLRVLPYDQVGLTAPLPPGAPARCRTTCATEALVQGGVVAPGGEPFQVQGVSGTIYRYVTWRPQACPALNARIATQLSTQWGASQTEIAAAVGNLCPGTQQTKRITVVVTAADVVRFTGPVRLSTVATDPEAGLLAAGSYDGLKVAAQPVVDAATGSAPPSPATAYAAMTSESFHLTDTPCQHDSRQPPGEGHASHDTSRPGAAACTGTAQADLMSPAPITGLVTDPLPDLSREVSRVTRGGRVLARDDRAGACASELAYDAADSDRRKRSVHTWASPAPSVPWETPDSGGRATLTLWTQVASAQQLPGRLCATLWRSGTGDVLGSTDYRLPAWPAAATQLAMSFDLAHAAVPAGERLILTLRTPEDSGTDLLLLYDHPGYQSALTVTTKQGREILAGAAG